MYRGHRTLDEASWELSQVLAECKFSVCENTKASIMALHYNFTEALLTCGIYRCVFCRERTGVDSLQPSEYLSPSSNNNIPLKLDVN